MLQQALPLPIRTPAKTDVMLSLCMIVRNEQPRLGTCLESVRPVADEIIVVDTGSTDGTQELACQYGARVLTYPWNDDFSAARNVGLAAATGNWILVLDADERLNAAYASQLTELLLQQLAASSTFLPAFRLVVRNSSDGGVTGASARIVRLFPNRPDVRYESPIHEQIAPSLFRAGVPILDTEIEIIHSGYADPALYVEKQHRNRRLLETQVATSRDSSALTYFLLGGARLDLDDFEAANGAYREAARLAPPGSELAIGSTVRLATCLVRLRRFEETLKLIAANPDALAHPELQVLHGECELAVSRNEQARLSFESVLSQTDIAFLPPCNLFAVKASALAALGQLWKVRGHSALAVEFLRAAVACRKAGLDFSREMLIDLYQRHRVSTLRDTSRTAQ